MRKLKFLNKRGSDTITPTTIGLVVLVVGFLVLLYFLFLSDLGGKSDQEICHNSVVLRSNDIVDRLSPLKCSTDSICLSEDKSCEKMTNPDIQKINDEEQTYKFLAERMADCWWMFGEGKLDYMGKKQTHENYCSICYQVGFDDSMREIFPSGKINKDRFYTYLTKNKVSGKDYTYSEYFFGTNDINALKDLAQEQFGAGGTFGTIDLSKRYYIMMGITSEVSTVKWVFSAALVTRVATVVGALVGGLIGVATPVGWVATAIVAGGIAAGVGSAEIADSIDPEISAIVVEGRGIDNSFMAPTIIEANSEKYKLLNCEDVKTLA